MKRLLSLTLAAALMAALTLPASAAGDTAGARLTRVTQAVKSTLSLDTSAYETFDGGSSEDLLVPTWHLSWGREDRSRILSIDALEDGTILNLYRWENDVRPGDYRWTFPTFPDNGGSEARALAEDFLDRVLRPGESVELEEPYNKTFLDASDSSWSGYIYLNGLRSSLRWSLSVENGQVTHFGRDVPETSVIGSVPGPDAPASASGAEKSLHETLKLNLEYVRDGEGRAILRYMPQPAHAFQVDAKTGELIDVTELEEKLSSAGNRISGGAADAAAPTAMKMEAAGENGSLTEVEQTGIQEMEGVLSKEELDKALRAVSAYGLRGYVLTGTVYTPWSSEEDGTSGVDCELRYTRSQGEDRLRRNITVDAKTGEVQAVWSSAPYGREAELTQDEALEQAGAYLKELFPDHTVEFYSNADDHAVPLRSKDAPSFEFCFARKENGVFFPGNEYQIGIDCVDGSLYYLSSTWDEEMTFEDPEGVVTPETAMSAWAGTYDTVLAYRSVPQPLSKADPVQAHLMEQGMEYYYGLRLTYALEREGYYDGVDARTGKPVQNDDKNTREPLVYTDLSGSSARADIEKLARYGVGYDAETFRPSKSVTQWELIALLSSLQGPALEPETASKDIRDSAYFDAYRRGVLRQTERDDDAVLTRADLVRLLLNAAGYGPAARLTGVYTCDYTDRSSIPQDGSGYAALAQALEMASGTYAGDRSATRGEAASMLCRLLERPI